MQKEGFPPAPRLFKLECPSGAKEYSIVLFALSLRDIRYWLFGMATKNLTISRYILSKEYIPAALFGTPGHRAARLAPKACRAPTSASVTAVGLSPMRK